MKKLVFILFTLLAGCSVSALEKNDSFMIIAHRGDNQNAPEHTLLAYDKAVVLGADYIEIDLRRTKDGQLVSIHDETIDRTTDGKGRVSDYTLSELKEFNAGTELHPAKILTLEEIVNHFEKSTKYYIEIRDKEMAKPVLEILTKYNVLDRAIIQSFSEDSLREVRNLNKDIPIFQLLINLEELNVESIAEYAEGVGVNAELVDKEFVRRMHINELSVHPFFFDKTTEQRTIDNLITYGIDGVFTDRLESTITLRDSQ